MPVACLNNYLKPTIARVAQLVEHFLGKEKVIGSIPIAGSSYKIIILSFIAYLQEI